MLKIVLLAALALLLSACNIRTNNSTNTPFPTLDIPRVQFISPANQQQLPEGTVLDINLLAEDSVGVVRIELTVDDLLFQTVSTDNNTPLASFSAAISWPVTGAGIHSMTAEAFRADGTKSSSANIIVDVQPQPEVTPG